MINFYLIDAFSVASLLLLATPGPNLLALLGRGISQGRQAAIMYQTFMYQWYELKLKQKKLKAMNPCLLSTLHPKYD